MFTLGMKIIRIFKSSGEVIRLGLRFQAKVTMGELSTVDNKRERSMGVVENFMRLIGTLQYPGFFPLILIGPPAERRISIVV